jgi:hypothetical protein
MSVGMQRNEANEIALCYNLKGVPYQTALTCETSKYNLRKVSKTLIKQVTESFKKMAEVLKK